MKTRRLTKKYKNKSNRKSIKNIKSKRKSIKSIKRKNKSRSKTKSKSKSVSMYKISNGKKSRTFPTESLSQGIFLFTSKYVINLFSLFTSQ